MIPEQLINFGASRPGLLIFFLSFSNVKQFFNHLVFKETILRDWEELMMFCIG
jgi:hypothetical protein